MIGNSTCLVILNQQAIVNTYIYIYSWLFGCTETITVTQKRRTPGPPKDVWVNIGPSRKGTCPAGILRHPCGSNQNLTHWYILKMAYAYIYIYMCDCKRMCQDLLTTHLDQTAHRNLIPRVQVLWGLGKQVVESPTRLQRLPITLPRRKEQKNETQLLD